MQVEILITILPSAEKGGPPMYYINPTPNITGNHGNPMGQPFPGSVALQDDLLDPYIEARGFVTLTLEGNTVTAVEANQTALDDYLAANPDTDPVAMPTLEKRIAALESAMLSMMGVEPNV